MNFNNLDESNYTFFAMSEYNNPQCTCIEDFHEDMCRIKYIKRHFSTYRKDGTLKERLVLNHIIMFYNVFPARSATKMLFFKVPEHNWSILKSFLAYLNFMPEDVGVVNGRKILSADIEEDEKIKNKLEGITNGSC